MSLEIRLGDAFIGTLERGPSGRGTRLVLHEDYRQARVRPVLGQQFIDFRREYRDPSRLLPFFADLLPEGTLRSLVLARARLEARQSWELLRWVGADLPGAVRVSPGADAVEAVPDDSTLGEPSAGAAPANDILRFSLTGVQLKFSMSWLHGRLSLPASYLGGKWIVKFGDSVHPDLPDIEWSMMTWARASGICVPRFERVPLSRVDDIPSLYTERGGEHCFAIERFDRGPEAVRIHMEDFAQVFAADDKYRGQSYETIGNAINVICGPEDFREYIRRLVFMVLSGNGDAHLKNWSLLYPDGLHARLSPAYDLVATVTYPQYERKLALNIAGSREFGQASLGAFARLARKLRHDEAAVLQWVGEDVARIHAAWQTLRSELPLASERRELIEAHLRMLLNSPGSIIHA